MKNYSKIILGVAASLFAVTGCMEKELLDPSDSSVIRFGVNTEYDNGEETRTEYSGQFTGSSPKRETINWLSTDRIRIVSAETTGAHQNDYTITPQSDKSTATVSPVSTDNQFYWANGTDDHYFYALYPAATQTGAPSGVSIATASGHTATVTGSIPADQSTGVTLSGRTYKPNMNYAYMYAAKKQKNNNPPTTANVTLEFNPLVTAFEFSVLADNNFPFNSNLTKAELISSSTNLAGNFTAILDASATSTSGLSNVSVTTGATKTLTITFPNGGIQLSKTDPTTFTFLALPVQQTNLTLKLTFSSEETRSLALKQGNNFISVAARKKVYIKSVGVVPTKVYHFDVQANNNLIIPATPGSNDKYPFTVDSTVEFDGQTKPISWTASFSLDNGVTWSSTKPSWISSIPTTGSGHSENKATLTNNNQAVGWAGSTTAIGSKSSPIDLSKRDINGKDLTNGRSTANCYVISAPGWYMIPVVYGNAIKNGGENTYAFYNGRSGSNILSRFLNHNNSGIYHPWIEDDVSPISDAILCWQDWASNGPVSDVELITINDADAGKERKFIRFQINASGLTSGGNALIAATSNGTIVWSWHIWMIPQSQLYTLGTKSQNGDTYQMLSVNLGWYGSSIPLREVLVRITQNDTGAYEDFVIHQDNGNDILFGGNTYYQWGRKDPMLGFTTGFVVKDQSGYRQFYIDEIKWTANRVLNVPNGIKSVDTSIGDAIRNPNWYIASPHDVRIRYGIWYTFSMFDKVQYRWYNNTRYDNLWNADGVYDPDHNKDTRVVKTVYDPCPVGFKVPSTGAFKNARVDKYVQGKGQWYYPSSTDPRGLLFPATSLREVEGGVRLGYDGVYMYTAGHEPHTSDGFPNGTYYEGRNATLFTGRAATGADAYGFAVRPIAE